MDFQFQIANNIRIHAIPFFQGVFFKPVFILVVAVILVDRAVVVDCYNK